MKHSSRSLLTCAVSVAVAASTAGVAQASPPHEVPALQDASVADVLDVFAHEGGFSERASAVVAELIDDPVAALDGLVLAEDGSIAAILPDELDPRLEIPLDGESILVDIEGAEVSGVTPDGVTRLDAGGDLFTVHGTAGGVQIVNVATVPVDEHSFALGTELPSGASWAPRADGGLDLVNEAGDSLGEIAAPWSVDNDGVRLATWFEVDGDQITQRIDTRGAAFPVVSDPKVSLWTKTKCIGSIALLAGGAYVKLASIAMKLKNMATWSRGFSTAYRNVVGSSNFTVGELKYLLGMLKKYAQGKLSKVDHKKVAAFVNQAGAAALAVAGLEDCGRWWGWTK